MGYVVKYHPVCGGFGGRGGFPKIEEDDHPGERNACDAPPLKLMHGVIHVATNGILNTENTIEEYV